MTNFAKTPWADWMRKLQKRYVKCPSCGKQRAHHYHVHTFVCYHCKTREWYAERMMDIHAPQQNGVKEAYPEEEKEEVENG